MVKQDSASVSYLVRYPPISIFIDFLKCTFIKISSPRAKNILRRDDRCLVKKTRLISTLKVALRKKNLKLKLSLRKKQFIFMKALQYPFNPNPKILA